MTHQLYVLVCSAHKNYPSGYDLYSVESDVEARINKVGKYSTPISKEFLMSSTSKLTLLSKS